MNPEKKPPKQFKYDPRYLRERSRKIHSSLEETVGAINGTSTKRDGIVSMGLRPSGRIHLGTR